MKWVTHPEDREFYGKQEITEEKLAKILSPHPEFKGYAIEEDNEGQLIIYTGLYYYEGEQNVQKAERRK